MLSGSTIQGLGWVINNTKVITGADFTSVLAVNVYAQNTINVASGDAYMTVRKVFAEYKPI